MNLTLTARKLRMDMTDAEKLMWYFLKGKNLNGLKFRRQEPVGKYIVDFVCFEICLAIEIDGGQHMGTEQKEKDLERDQWFRSQGFSVLRFWNNEVLGNKEGVLNKILEFCGRHSAPSPNPSHQGRGRGSGYRKVK